MYEAFQRDRWLHTAVIQRDILNHQLTDIKHATKLEDVYPYSKDLPKPEQKKVASKTEWAEMCSEFASLKPKKG